MLSKFSLSIIIVFTVLVTCSLQEITVEKTNYRYGRVDCILEGSYPITSNNINSFKNCTSIRGNIIITHETFEKMNPDKLEVFSTLQEINGSLRIMNAFNNHFNNLSYFRNIQNINSKTNLSNSICLSIENTSLHSLNLRSLTSITGIIKIKNNRQLCYINQVNLAKLLYVPALSTIEDNRGYTDCLQEGFICDPQCSEDGCWGAGPDQCLRCRNYRLYTSQKDFNSTSSCYDDCRLFPSDAHCVQSCPVTWFGQDGECYPCHEQCHSGCTGSGADACTECKHFKDGSICVETCSWGKYTDGRDCQPCHKLCASGCTGPDADQCDSCKFVQSGRFCVKECSNNNYIYDGECRQCDSNCSLGCNGPSLEDCFTRAKPNNIQEKQEFCPSLSYEQNGICIPCHEQCNTGCHGSGADTCISCKNFKEESSCVSFCQSTIFNNQTRECKPCHDECEFGCHGPGADDCVSCKNFKDGSFCAPSCPSTIFDSHHRVCKPCHEECIFGCYGPEADSCNICKHSKDGAFCVPNCPRGKYDQNGECKHCHKECELNCNGPDATNCEYCKNVRHRRFCVETCPPLTYEQNSECKLCHDQCDSGCSGPGADKCTKCKSFMDNSICVAMCPLNKFIENGICIACHSLCTDGCSGTGSNYGKNGCNSCDKAILTDDTITCVSSEESCPDGYINKTNSTEQRSTSSIFVKSLCRRCDSDHVCRTNDKRQMEIILYSFSSLLITVAILSIIFYYRFRRKSTMRIKENTLIELEHIRPSKYSPNLARINTVKESEIQKIKKLGHGSFGIVHKGIWTPKSNKHKLQIAIKTLKTVTGADTNDAFLNEALIMATMDHPNILHLIAICIATETMLITQLMPLGCLLNYLRANSQHISPTLMMKWCTQIAKGMAYLEEKHLVHRNLAARNVLLETVECLKIADFGLSQFKKMPRDEQIDSKFPIRWLALECIEKRIFSYKSDVWAFGVTVWEVLTFGEQPYGNINVRELPALLRLGEKLQQPPICSLDLYLRLIQCWIITPECRPSFSELAIEFQKMSYDPGNYLTNSGVMHFKLLNSLERTVDHTLLPTVHTAPHSDQRVSSQPIYQDGYLVPNSGYTGPSLIYEEIGEGTVGYDHLQWQTYHD